MSYEDALICFQTNLNEIEEAETEMEIWVWNLSSGLGSLTEAIQADLADIRTRLARMESHQ